MAEFGVERGPNRQTLVREQDLGVDTVQCQVGHPGFGCLSRVGSEAFVAGERVDPVELCLPEPLGLLELFSRDPQHDARQAIEVLGVDSSREEVVRFLDVAVGRRHEELVRCVRSGGANPAVVDAGGFCPPNVVDVGFGDHVGHEVLQQGESDEGFRQSAFGRLRQMRSTMVAVPMPPPVHIAMRPVCRSRRSSSSMMVPMSIAPVAPMG